MAKASSARPCSDASSASKIARMRPIYSAPKGIAFHSDPLGGAGNVHVRPSAKSIGLPWRNEGFRFENSSCNLSGLQKMGPFEMLNEAVVALTQLILILPGNAGYGEL